MLHDFQIKKKKIEYSDLMSLLQSKIPGLNCNDVFKILTQFENHLYKYVKSQKRKYNSSESVIQVEIHHTWQCVGV